MNKNGKERIGLNKYYHKKKGNKILSEYNDIKKIVDNLKLSSNREDYHDVKKIGEGTFGHVMLCEYTKFDTDPIELTKNKYALKMIKKTPHMIVTDIYIEIYLQSVLIHPHIVKCYGWFEDDFKYYIVLDYIEGFDLYDIIYKNKITYENNIIHNYLLQLIDILYYLRLNNVIHRDIKLENIIVDTNNNIYLCDFGLASVMNDSNKIIDYDRRVGTQEYMTPECVSYNEYNYTSDLWAFGIIAYELFYKYYPFQMCSNNKYVLFSMPIVYDDNDPSLKVLNDMLRNIFKPYNERCTIEKCMSDDFFINNIL
jgi:serine/threonine protein kinase